MIGATSGRCDAACCCGDGVTCAGFGVAVVVEVISNFGGLDGGVVGMDEFMVVVAGALGLAPFPPPPRNSNSDDSREPFLVC